MIEEWDALLEETFGFLVSDFGFKKISERYWPEGFGNRHVEFKSSFCSVAIDLDKSIVGILFNKPDVSNSLEAEMKFLLAYLDDDPQFILSSPIGWNLVGSVEEQMKRKSKLLRKNSKRIFAIFENADIKEEFDRMRAFLSRVDIARKQKNLSDAR
jgi:hypothetical protein